jgi:hypothetical protein
MSTWTDRIRTHDVWKQLEALGPVIDNAKIRAVFDIPATEGLERLRAVLGFCGKRLASADPDLVDPRPLASLVKSLTTARAELDTYIADQNSAHVTNANSQADDILAASAKVLTTVTLDDLTAISEAASSYRSLLDRNLESATAGQKEVAAQIEANRSALADLGNGLNTEKQRLQNILTEQQSQFSVAQANRGTEFTAAQTERQTQYSAALTEMRTALATGQTKQANDFAAVQSERQQKFSAASSEQQSGFSTAQDNRNKEFTDAQNDRGQSFATLIAEQKKTLSEQQVEITNLREALAKNHTEALQGLRTQYEESAANILKAIEDRKRQVEKLVGVIGNLGVTSGYQKVANRAEIAVYIWQGLTVAALSGLIFVAYLIAFSTAVPGAPFFQGLATRVFLSVAVGIFAGYAARQAKINMDIERRSRKLALELEAFGPFVAPLPVEMQNEFRRDFGQRSFGVPDGDLAQSAKPEADPVTAADLVKVLLEAMKRSTST